jgi:hypothetical protein
MFPHRLRKQKQTSLVRPFEGDISPSALPYANQGVIMNKLKIFVVVLVAVNSLLLLAPAGKQGMLSPAGAAYAQDDWKAEFEAICSKTQDSAALSPDELNNLVDRCDKLRPRIEKLDETQRKVYLKRLQMCRDLFAFVLESKEKK